MQKKALLAMLLALTVLLSGCALIVKDPVVDAATEIIRKDGKSVTKAEVLKQTETELAQTATMYSYFYGSSYDVTDPENIASARESAVRSLEEKIIREEKIREYGLDQLTEDEEAEVQTTAQSNYDSDIEYAKNYLLADSGLEGDELTEAAKKELEDMGFTLEQYAENARNEKLTSKLREYVIRDVAVTDDEITEEYNARVETGKSNYENNAGSWAAAANNGTTLYYTPEGVRRVKQILVKFTAEGQAAVDAARAKVTELETSVKDITARRDDAQALLDSETATEEEKTQAQADLTAAAAELETANADLAAANDAVTAAVDAAYAGIDEAADSILAQLAEGADWDTLMAEKTEDPGMQAGRSTAETGYAIAEGMTSFDAAFVEAGMALAAVGDVSAKTRGSSDGYYIIRYVGDEPAGPVELDKVKETISSSLLTTKQNSTYTDTINQWVEAAGFKVDWDALKN